MITPTTTSAVQTTVSADNNSSNTAPPKQGVMQDHTGKTSMMRLMSMLALLTSIGFGYLTLKLNSDQGVYITTMFILAAFVPKALQKFVESAYPTKN